MVERHVDTFKQLGFSIDLKNPHFQKANLSQEILSITGAKKSKLIGIAPFPQYESQSLSFGFNARSN